MHPAIAVPAISLLVIRAYRKKSLTPAGLAAALLTAVIHAVHPWSVFFALLAVFFLSGTHVTKVKHDVKARLTLSSSGASGGEGSRTHIQVLANSAVASVLILLHYRLLLIKGKEGLTASGQHCWSYREDLLVVGIVSNYAAVAADTFSSELGILSKTKPRLLTSISFRQVPPGTNGGITLLGTMAGFLGAFLIALTTVILLPFCPAESFSTPGLQGGTGWGWSEKSLWLLAVTLWGGLGSLLDSALGGWLQSSVIDTRTGKIIEGAGGKKVLINVSPSLETTTASATNTKKDSTPSRKIESGAGLLDNNGVNFLMAFLMSAGGMLLAGYLWDLPLADIFA